MMQNQKNTKWFAFTKTIIDRSQGQVEKAKKKKNTFLLVFSAMERRKLKDVEPTNFGSFSTSWKPSKRSLSFHFDFSLL